MKHHNNKAFILINKVLSEIDFDLVTGLFDRGFKEIGLEAEYKEKNREHQGNMELLGCCSIFIWCSVNMIYYNFIVSTVCQNFPWFIWVQSLMIISSLGLTYLIVMRLKNLYLKAAKYSLYYLYCLFFSVAFLIMYYSEQESKWIDILSLFYTAYFALVIAFICLLDCSKLDSLFTSSLLMSLAIYISFHTKSKKTYYVEICSGSGFFFFYYFKLSLDNFYRASFVWLKKIELTHSYYMKFINEMDIQLVSFCNSHFVFSNISFNKDFEIYKHATEENEQVGINLANELNDSDLSIKLREYLQNFHKQTFSSSMEGTELKEVHDNYQVNHSTSTNLNEIINELYSYNTQDSTTFSSEEKANFFINLGQYENSSMNNSKKIYHVVVRIFSVAKCKRIVDLVLKDITGNIEVERQSTENTIKKKIISKMAHEFKTPLIILSSETQDLCLILKKQISLDYLKRIEMLSSLSDYTSFLIDDIIQYSTNFANLKIFIEDVENFANILQFCFEIMKSYHYYIPGASKNVELLCELDPDINDYIIKTDKTRIKQILLNFISNAIKFTKQGSIKLKASYSHLNSSIVVEIIDTGVGFDSSNVMERLGKGINDIKINQISSYNNMGTGLGLSISLYLANMLDNHKLDVSSQIGVGTTVKLSIGETHTKIFSHSRSKSGSSSELSRTVTLNRTNSAENFFVIDEFRNSKIVCNSNTNRHFSVSSYELSIEPKILTSKASNYLYSIAIVDDSPQIRSTIRKLLYSLKGSILEMFEFEDGIDLLNYIKEDQTRGRNLKLILIDENMQYLNGSETIRIIRKLESFGKIQKAIIVSITAFSDSHNRNEILCSGANKVYNKPINKSNLLEVLDLML